MIGIMTKGFTRLTYLVIASSIFCISTNATIVTVEFPSLPPTAATTCDLPDSIDVIIHIPHQTVSLNLLRKTEIVDSPPVFCLRQSSDGSPRMSREDSLGKKVKEVMYQDDLQDADFEVSCSVDESTLILDGSLKLEDGKMYSLQKSVEKSSSLYNLTELTMSSLSTGALEMNDEDEEGLDANILSGMTMDMLQLSTDVFIDIITLVEFTVYERFLSKSVEETPELKRTDTIARISRYFAHVFNTVNVRFKTASSHINMNLVGYVIEDTQSGDWFQSVLDNETNKNFIDASKLLDTQDILSLSDGFPEHDHLVSFTALDIYWLVNGTPSYDLAGLATVGEICVEDGKSVSIVEFQDYFIVDVHITAHEIGHCLSARHDGTNGNTCVAADNFIMAASPLLYTNSNPYTFSTCSAEYFDNHITGLLAGSSTYERNCLLQSLQAVSVPVLSKLRGQIFTFDEQCQIQYGNDSYVCRHTDPPICLDRSCYNSSDGFCYGRYADRGTTCGDRMWCEAGACVFSESAPLADPNCLLGDQPVFDDGSNCTSRVTSADSCTDSRTESECCDRCKTVICGIQCLRGGYINGSTCTCVCPDCYRGTICDVPPIVCQNGGTQNKTTCECQCATGFSGDLCEQTPGVDIGLALGITLALILVIAIHVLVILWCLLRRNKVHPLRRRRVRKVKRLNLKDKVLTVGGVYPDEVKKYRTEVLFPILKQARSENKRCRLVVDKLYINGKLFTPPVPPPYRK